MYVTVDIYAHEVELRSQTGNLDRDSQRFYACLSAEFDAPLLLMVLSLQAVSWLFGL